MHADSVASGADSPTDRRQQIDKALPRPMLANPDPVARLLEPQMLQAVDVLAARINASREALLAHLATRGLEVTLQETEAG